MIKPMFNKFSENEIMHRIVFDAALELGFNSPNGEKFLKKYFEVPPLKLYNAVLFAHYPNQNPDDLVRIKLYNDKIKIQGVSVLKKGIEMNR